jgi:hypothetical protein
VLVVLAACACHVCVPVEATFERYGEGVTQAWRLWKTSRRGWSDGHNLMDRVCLCGEWRHDSKQSERTFVLALDPFAGSFLRWHGFMVVCFLSRPIAAGLCFAMLPPIEAMPVAVAMFALYLVVTWTTRPFVSRIEAALDGWNTCATLVWLAVQTVEVHGGFEDGGDAAVVSAWVQLVIVYSLLVVGILSILGIWPPSCWVTSAMAVAAAAAVVVETVTWSKARSFPFEPVASPLKPNELASIDMIAGHTPFESFHDDAHVPRQPQSVAPSLSSNLKVRVCLCVTPSCMLQWRCRGAFAIALAL